MILGILNDMAYQNYINIALSKPCHPNHIPSKNEGVSSLEINSTLNYTESLKRVSELEIDTRFAPTLKDALPIFRLTSKKKRISLKQAIDKERFLIAVRKRKEIKLISEKIRLFEAGILDSNLERLLV